MFKEELMPWQDFNFDSKSSSYILKVNSENSYQSFEYIVKSIFSLLNIHDLELIQKFNSVFIDSETATVHINPEIYSIILQEMKDQQIRFIQPENVQKRVFLKLQGDNYYIHIPESGCDVLGLHARFIAYLPKSKFERGAITAVRSNKDGTNSIYNLEVIRLNQGIDAPNEEINLLDIDQLFLRKYYGFDFFYWDSFSVSHQHDPKNICK